jgi:hypothetical protein
VTELAGDARLARDPASHAGTACRASLYGCVVYWRRSFWLVIAWSMARLADVGDVGPAGLLTGCMATIGPGCGWLPSPTFTSIFPGLPEPVPGSSRWRCYSDCGKW